MRFILLRLGIPAVVLLSLWLLWPFFQSPATQATRRHQSLFHHAGKRSWSEAASHLSPSYQDAWGNSGRQAIEIARELLAGFLVLELQWQPVDVQVQDHVIIIQGHVRIEGSGGGLSQIVISKLRNLQQPWTFTWRKEGRIPGSWRLIHVGHPELQDLPASSL